MSDSLWPHGLQHTRPLSIATSWSLLKPMSIESVMPSCHLILCRPLLFLPPIPPSIGVFSNESVLHIRRPEYWSFSFSISHSSQCSGLITFRSHLFYDHMDCSPPGSSVHGILQAKTLDWVDNPFSRGIFPTQGLNPGLPHCRQILWHLSHQGSLSPL